MRKLIPINLDNYSKEEWIDLPQDNHVHPIELQKMFDNKEMSEGGREYGARIIDGKPYEEVYGDEKSIKFHKPITYDDAKESIMTHSHPRFELEQELDKGIVVAAPFSDYDLRNHDREVRAFSQNKDELTGQIHSFKLNDNGSEEDIYNRKNNGDKLLDEVVNIAKKNRHTKKYNDSMRTVKGFPMSTNIYTASEFNLARKGLGNASIINVKKSEVPNQMYVTKIRSTYKEEPRYDLLSTIRKKKQTKPKIKVKQTNNMFKLNMNFKLNTMLTNINVDNILYKPNKKVSKKKSLK
jgi:hypothetical protein